MNCEKLNISICRYFKYKIVLIFFLNLQYSIAQQHLIVQNYDSEQGLSQNSVWSITQSGDGFMWFGTQDRLNRFDGSRFMTIFPNPLKRNGKLVNGKLSKMVCALCVDKKGFIWIGTTKEIYIYDRIKDKSILPDEIYPGFEIPQETFIKVIKEDERFIYVASSNNGLFIYDKLQKRMINLIWITKKEISIVSIFFDDFGQVYFASENEIYKLKNHNTIEKIKLNFPRQTMNHPIADAIFIKSELWVVRSNPEIYIFELHNNKQKKLKFFKQVYHGNGYIVDPKIIMKSDSNTVWIGCRSDGVLKIDLATKKYIKLNATGSKNSLKRPFVLSLFTDNQKNVWIGLSGGGVAKYDAGRLFFESWYNKPVIYKQMYDNMVLSIFKLSNTEFLLGTQFGGLCYKNIITNEFKYFKPESSSIKFAEFNNIYSIIHNGDSTFWLACKGGIFYFNFINKKFELYNDLQNIQTKEVCSMIKLKNTNKLLLASYNGGMCYFDTKTKKFERCNISKNLNLRVRYMIEKENGEIWLCTETKNFCHYDHKNNNLSFHPEFEKISGTSRHLNVDKRYIWIATDDGLIQADKLSYKVIKLWTVEDGLPNNVIYAIEIDDKQNVWISTNNGLARLDPQTGFCKAFTINEGIQAMEFNTASCYKDENNVIWFGGINGFNKIPQSLNEFRTFSPPPIITNIDVMNLPYKDSIAIPYIKNITLNHKQNFIRFEYRALNYSQSENISYKYKLSSVDTNWVYNGIRNYANYTQLKPGNYTFTVISSNSDQVWSDDTTRIHFTILNPWYQSWWFYLICTASVLVVVAYFVILRINNLKYKFQLQQQMVKSELEKLKLQMNPHFIFNSLNSINSFIVENKTNLASDYLTKFSRLIRLILDNSKNETITLEREIETLKLYLLMESLRFNQSFEYSINIEEDLDTSEIIIPPLIIQPFVENAIWHGLMHKLQDRKLLINVSKNNENEIFIEIIDNGVGRAKAAELKSKSVNKNKSYGLEITKQRLTKLNFENSITIGDLYDSNHNAIGTKVCINFKIS